jgi:hypothetical protein
LPAGFTLHGAWRTAILAAAHAPFLYRVLRRAKQYRFLKGVSFLRVSLFMMN